MSATAIDSPIAAQPEEWELRRPEKSVIDLALACGAAGLAVALTKPFFSYNPLGSDEGIAFQGALRILHGEIPYRDFFVFYTPGCYYLYAVLFKIFGVSMGAARTLLAGYAALFSFLTYLLARRVSSRPASFFFASLLALICLPSRFQNLHSWDSTVAALLALYSAAWLIQTGSRYWAFLAGLFTGCAAMIEQTRGAGMIFGFVLAALVFYRLDPQRWKPAIFFPAIIGSAVPVLATVGYFAAHHALQPMLAGWFWPLEHYTGANRLPYGYMFWSQAHIFGSMSPVVQAVFAVAMSATFAVSFFPIALTGLGAFVTGRALLRRHPITALSGYTILIAAVLWGNLLAAFATGRPDYLRIIYIAPLFFFAIPLLLDLRLSPLRSLPKLWPLLAVYLVISFAECYLLMAARPNDAKQVIYTRRGMIRTESDQVIEYLQKHVPTGGKVLIHPYEATYSFLTGTFSPSRYDFVQSGMHTQAQFAELREDVAKDGTRVVVLDLTFLSIVSEVWPSTPAEALARDPVTDYILANYRTCRILQSRRRPFAYMVRKDLPCPSD